MRIGQKVDLGGIYAEVLSLTKDLRPQRVRFTFPLSLDDPSLIIYRWKEQRYVSFTPPQMGKTVVIKGDFSDFFG